MSKFDSIRPYADQDLARILAKFKKNQELIDTIVAYRFSHWPVFCRPVLKWIVSRILDSKLSAVRTVRDFQIQVEPYMQRMIATTTRQFSISGLEDIDLENPCLFISNHRDITMDPAFVNWALHTNGKETVRIAIGDNLLTKDWVSDLMRLNKSFIVNRSAEGKREKLAASKLLSEYIHHTLTEEHQHVWIAQREGRAKDGHDLTNPALISMLALNRPKDRDFADYIRELRIVPVAISYEFDPCDTHKANELHQIETQGSYQKQEQEDIESITQGITGFKGSVHLHFARPYKHDLNSAREVAEALDQSIISGYRCFATNLEAAVRLKVRGAEAGLKGFTPEEQQRASAYLDERLSGLSEGARQKLLSAYAAPFENQQKLKDSSD